MSLKELFRAKKNANGQEEQKVFVVDTNIPLHYIRFGQAERLQELQGAYIPWAVIKELMTSAQQAESDKPELREDARRLEWRKFLYSRGWTREMILARESRCLYAERACSFVQKKVNDGDWKTIGTYEETRKYVDGFSEFQQLRRADLEILASCFLLAEQLDCVMVLITRDRRLREVAEGFGIKTQDSII